MLIILGSLGPIRLKQHVLYSVLKWFLRLKGDFCEVLVDFLIIGEEVFLVYRGFSNRQLMVSCSN